uniref:CARD_2 domain-containing protein n=1 Tax=Steinernema glaseri TaxID=37863 RepID=A0A1I7Z432_9BILA
MNGNHEQLPLSAKLSVFFNGIQQSPPSNLDQRPPSDVKANNDFANALQVELPTDDDSWSSDEEAAVSGNLHENMLDRQNDGKGESKTAVEGPVSEMLCNGMGGLTVATPNADTVKNCPKQVPRYQCESSNFLYYFVTEIDLLKQTNPNLRRRIEDFVYDESMICNRAIILSKILNDPGLRAVLMKEFSQEKCNEIFAALWSHYPSGSGSPQG